MASFSFEQQQRTSQLQTQIMSQQQILALKLLQMGSQDLRNEIYSQIEENPALELVKDPYAEGAVFVRKGSQTISSSTRVGSASSYGQQESDTYQKMLESTVDKSETLQDHLLHQLNMHSLSKVEYNLCEKIIENLDEKGYFILAPISLLDSSDPAQTETLLNRCLDMVQHLEPWGICVKNVTESLFLQAKLNENAPGLALFLLNGHLELLSNTDVERVQKKIIAWQEEQKKLAFRLPEPYEPVEKPSIKQIQEAVTYIQNLDPYPARDFDSGKIQFVRPDVSVSLCNGLLEKDFPEKGLICESENQFFKIVLVKDSIPELKISGDFEDKTILQKISDAEQKNFMRQQMANAQSFISTLNFRQEIILKTCSLLVKEQKDFFRFGPGHLVPFTQRQFAEILGVHESSVSRMADSKFIRCKWGLFPIKYFFTSGITKKAVQVVIKNEETVTESIKNASEEGIVSSDTVKHEIEKILKNQKPGEKRLSDQKISDLLAEKGYQVARRTVSKYRTQLNIASSYDR